MDSLQQHLDKLLREEQVELAATCASSILGIRAGLTPNQQSLFNTPWGKAPESEEEQFHQDLVWIHKVLPPNDKFNPKLAEQGIYKKMRLKVLADFWKPIYEKADLEEQGLKLQKTYKRHIPNNKKRLPVPIRTSLRAIRKNLAEGGQIV